LKNFLPDEEQLDCSSPIYSVIESKFDTNGITYICKGGQEKCNGICRHQSIKNENLSNGQFVRNESGTRGIIPSHRRIHKEPYTAGFEQHPLSSNTPARYSIPASINGHVGRGPKDPNGPIAIPNGQHGDMVVTSNNSETYDTKNKLSEWNGSNVNPDSLYLKCQSRSASHVARYRPQYNSHSIPPEENDGYNGDRVSALIPTKQNQRNNHRLIYSSSDFRNKQNTNLSVKTMVHTRDGRLPSMAPAYQNKPLLMSPDDNTTFIYQMPQSPVMIQSPTVQQIQSSSIVSPTICSPLVYSNMIHSPMSPLIQHLPANMKSYQATPATVMRPSTVPPEGYDPMCSPSSFSTRSLQPHHYNGHLHQQSESFKYFSGTSTHNAGPCNRPFSSFSNNT